MVAGWELHGIARARLECGVDIEEIDKDEYLQM